MIVALSACAQHHPNSAGRGDTAWVAQWTREFLQLGNSDLETIRKEIAHPYTEKPSELAAMRIFGLRSLGKFANTHPVDANLDLEAERYTREGLQKVESDSQRALVLSASGHYYAASSRPGRAIPLFMKALGAQIRLKNAYRQWELLVALSTANSSSGNFARRDADWRAAEEIRRTSLPPKPMKAGFWLEYWRAIDGRMATKVSALNNESGVPETKDLDNYAGPFETIGAKHVTPKYLAPAKLAAYFAQVGRFDRANEMLAEAEVLAKSAEATTSPPNVTAAATAEDIDDEPQTEDRQMTDAEISLVVARTNVDILQGHCGDHAAELDRFIATRDQQGRKLPAPTFRWAAECHEQNGELDQAIAYGERNVSMVEDLRGSFTVAERAQVFRGPARTGYWGLMRALAKRSLTKKGAAADEDYLASLRTTELVRARQLGELLNDGKSGEAIPSIDAITAKLANDDAILSYVVTEKEILVFTITKTQHSVAIIPMVLGDLVKDASAIATALATAASDPKVLSDNLGKLGALLLAPSKPLLAGKKNLIVMPDGVLNIVPFELLSMRAAPYRPLIEDVSVRLTPSLAYLLTPDTAAKTANGFFGVGDPVYAPPVDAKGIAQDLSPAKVSTYLKFFTPLPETRDEISGIGKLFKEGKVSELVGADATESAVKHTDFSQFGFLHFATHGVLGRDVPGLSEPAIVLGHESGEDGFLTASEAMKLHLNAKLTVLSACKTGAGDYRSGEGVMGMSRAFLVAGSRSVLVSLWSVDSAATEDLMIKFYDEFRTGMEPAEALRRAKLAVRAGAAKSTAPTRGLTLDSAAVVGALPQATGRSHPFYWSAFQIVGR